MEQESRMIIHDKLKPRINELYEHGGECSIKCYYSFIFLFQNRHKTVHLIDKY